MSRACLHVLRLPLKYALKTLGMSRADLFDILEEYEHSEQFDAQRGVVAFLSKPSAPTDDEDD